MSAFDAITNALSAAGCKVVAHGDRARAQCPVHGSRGLTLSIRSFTDRASVKCFAGCEDTDVLAAVGLEVRDLFDRPGRPGRRRTSPPSLSAWDIAMLDLSERYHLGWRGPGDYPPVDHVLDRMMQEQRRRDDRLGRSA